MEFRPAVEADVKRIMEIIKEGQESLKASGVNQWQNNYPNTGTILEDIDQQNGYVLLVKQVIVGTVAVIFEGEKTYDAIYNGQWLTNREYATIHRIAVDAKHKGLGALMIKEIEKMCLNKDINSIRIDTHKDNIPMQKRLEKSGFQYCGLIYLEDKSERVAFEKIID